MNGIATEKHFQDCPGGYWDGRWEAYLRQVCLFLRLLDGMHFRHGHVLEVGPGERPLVVGSQRMDKRELQIANLVVCDIENPWPWQDGAFDLVIMLQVIEHVAHDTECLVMDECKRVGSHLLLSIPYQWTGGPLDHRGLDDSYVAAVSRGVRWDLAFEMGGLNGVPRRKAYFWEW